MAVGSRQMAIGFQVGLLRSAVSVWQCALSQNGYRLCLLAIRGQLRSGLFRFPKPSLTDCRK